MQLGVDWATSLSSKIRKEDKKYKRKGYHTLSSKDKKIKEQNIYKSKRKKNRRIYTPLPLNK